MQVSSSQRCWSIVMNHWKTLQRLEQCVICCLQYLHAHCIHTVYIPGLHSLRQVQIPIGFICIFLTKSTLFLESGRVLRQLVSCTRQTYWDQVYHRVLVSLLPCYVGFSENYLGDRVTIQKPLVLPSAKERLGRGILGVDCLLQY